MIISKIIGGLGNQMFQYAAGRAVAHARGTDLRVDISGFRRYGLHHGYRLNMLRVNAPEATPREITKLIGQPLLIDKIARRLHLPLRTNYYKERERTVFDAAIFERDSLYLDGYWQNERYFTAIRDTLLDEFVPRKELSAEAQAISHAIRSRPSVSIHVRRGDYLANPHFGVLDVGYYRRAVDLLASKGTDFSFFVFSDDLKWCQENLSFLPRLNLVSGVPSEVEEMHLMSRCSHNIIANSSFSWWGAWLNACADKTVIAPKQWMAENPAGHRWIPDSWNET